MPEKYCLKYLLGPGLLVAIAQILSGQTVSTPIFHQPALAQAPPNLDNITIGPRFSPNPLEVRGQAGGTSPARDLVGLSETPTGPCAGFASTSPNHTLVLTSFFSSLSLQVQASEDTALAIKGPGGVWCNDDYQGHNPGVAGQWLPGTYRIWVTAHDRNRRPGYVLRIAERR